MACVEDGGSWPAGSNEGGHGAPGATASSGQELVVSQQAQLAHEGLPPGFRWDDSTRGAGGTSEVGRGRGPGGGASPLTLNSSSFLCASLGHSALLC